MFFAGDGTSIQRAMTKMRNQLNELNNNGTPPPKTVLHVLVGHSAYMSMKVRPAAGRMQPTAIEV
jgi:hypothetical protein